MGETRKCFVFINTLIKLLGSYPVAENGNSAIFRWCSFRTFCSLFAILVTLLNAGLSAYERSVGYELVGLDASALAIQLSFLFMAAHWPELRKECDKIDFYMGSYRFPKRLNLKARLACVVLTILGLTMHVTVELLVQSRHIHALMMCIDDFKSSPSFATAFYILLAAIRKVSHFQIAMLRSFVDIYIMTVSMVLAARLRQVAEHVGLLIEKRIQNEEAWSQTRQDYQRVCAFIEKWDKILGYLVLASFISNIYIWHLEVKGLLNTSGAFHIFCIAVSSETLLRVLVVCYQAGNVYAEGTRLIENIVLTPPDVYNSEIDRIIVQLRQARPALTGKQLFTIKHSLIVQILGAIASHEIILLQYASSAKK